MQLFQLQYFMEVAKLGSINKAANSLMTTQPNVSKALKNLEDELNINIFTRYNKGVKITGEGETLLAYAKPIIEQMALIEKMSENNPQKTLHVTTYPLITFSNLVAKFYNNHKSDNLVIKLTEQRIQGIIESVTKKEAELGFVTINERQLKEFHRVLSYNNLEYHEIAIDTWYANIGPNNPLYYNKFVRMEELLPYTTVMLPKDYFTNLTADLEIDSIPVGSLKPIYVNNMGAVIHLVKTTDIYCFGPMASKMDLESYGIRTIPIYNCNFELHVGWIKSKKEILSEEAAEFVLYIEEMYNDIEV